MRNVILAVLEDNAFSEKAKKERARRRMDILDGNNKYLNSAERMEKYADYNQLMTLIASIKAERNEEKKRRKGKERKGKKNEKEAEKERKKQEMKKN